MHFRSPKVSRGSGNLQDWKKIATGITGKTDHSFFKIEFYSGNIVRVHLTQQETFSDFSYAVIAVATPLPFEVNDSSDYLSLKTSSTEIIISKKPFHITFKNAAGKVINQDEPSFGTWWNGEQVSSYKKLQEGERFIGLGEKTGPLDKRGRGYVNWNTDKFAYGTDDDPLYSSIPFYIGLHHQVMYGIYFDNSARTQFNFGASNDRFASFSADTGDMNYYFMAGNSVGEIIESYTSLTGRMPLPPRWSLGYQQCRYSYYPDREVINLAENFRDRDFPCDAIVLDIHYMDAYKIFTWDKQNFPNPKAMIASLKKLGFETVVICDPGIKIEEGYEAFDTGKKENVFVKYPDGTDYAGQVWPGWCNFPDFTNPKTREWWAQHFKEYVDFGVEGFWNDMNEIATWGNVLPDLIEFNMDGQPATAREARNVYGMMMSRSTYEGTKKLLKNKRPFNLTRSGYAGIQRYAAVWTGDNVAYDAHMLAGVRLVNSMGLSGIPFTGYDVGGFVGNADEKLFARWISIGAFSPFFRGHSMINSRDSEPWSYGEKVEEISRNYMKLRYRLLPYLYSLFYEASQTGMPVNRSLAIDFPFDENIYDHKYHNQYLFGPAILVAPVESTKDLTKVYLPEGNWYSLFTDHPYQGNHEMAVDCPIDQLPVYVRGSSIITMRVAAGSNTNDPGDALEIHLYEGKTQNTFLLYEDDGSSFKYESGEFAKRLLTYLPMENCFRISKQEGTFTSPHKKVNLFLHGFKEMKSVSVNGEQHPIQQKEYRFVQPITNFDPVSTMPEGPKISSLKFITTTYSQNQLEIRW
jgi:alpha-glucosidase